MTTDTTSAHGSRQPQLVLDTSGNPPPRQGPPLEGPLGNSRGLLMGTISGAGGLGEPYKKGLGGVVCILQGPFGAITASLGPSRLRQTSVVIQGLSDFGKSSHNDFRRRAGGHKSSHIVRPEYIY